MPAREKKLTPQLQDTICKYVRGGATLPHAAVAAGVSWNTVKEWAKPHMVCKEPYASFAEAVEQAKASWAAGAAVQITHLGKRDWKALAWMLERRNPDEYSAKNRVELSGAPGGEPIRLSVSEEQALAELREELEDNPELLRKLTGKEP